MEQVIAGNGLPAVARLLSDLLGLPATVADEEFQPLHAFAPRGRHLLPHENSPWLEQRPDIVKGWLQAELDAQLYFADGKNAVDVSKMAVEQTTGCLARVAR